MKQTLKYILSVVMENLKYAESKHAVSIALSSAIIIFSSTSLTSFKLVSTVFASISVLFCSISIGFSFLALMSRNITIKRRKNVMVKEHNDGVNLVYFKDIAEFGVVNYLNAIIKNYNFPNDYEPDLFDVDLAKQVLLNAKVTNLKFVFFNKSIQLLVVGIVFTIFMVIATIFGG